MFELINMYVLLHIFLIVVSLFIFIKMGKDIVTVSEARLFKLLIVTYCLYTHIQLVGRLTDESDAVLVFIDSGHMRATSRDELIRYVSSAGKKVKGCRFLQIYLIFKDIEQTFLCHIGCGARREVVGRHYLSSLMSSSYYSHVVGLFK